MTADDCQRLRAVVDARNNSGRTHWDGCHLDPTHRDCAITLLLAERDRLAAELTAIKFAMKHEIDLATKLTERDAELAELKKGEPTDSQLMAAAVDAQRRADNYAKKLGELSTELAELRAACTPFAECARAVDMYGNLNPMPEVDDCRRIAALLARTPEAQT